MVPDSVEVIDLTELTDSSDDDEDLGATQDETQSSSEDESGSSEGSEVAVDATSRAALHQAIASIPETHLRQVISNLVDSVPAVEQAMTRELVSFDPRTRAVTPRWEICENKVDKASFVDWDENCHGPMDTLANRQDTESEGCVTQEHMPAVPRKRQRRL
ncbi:hypothetical protein EDD18DRAFT_1177119 [Armillaria luteobubalina]|uniref:Uncharacterized protein n=1 Tax=Armillaria luteobubalina TaxID=153913 RepID=A0AA39TLI9_9AGAR|nr:hypothetical protein EDD18DRAFT_1177119 [Armillaria luteobubalina]